MIDAAYCRLMADYTAWMNERLYSLCATLSDDERKADRGAFFRSIHSTLNHIMFADLAFMSRFTGDPATIPDLGVDIHESFDELHEQRLRLDRRLVAWSRAVTCDWLEADMTFVSKVDGLKRTLPRWVAVVQMFNHETHHRGHEAG